MPKDGATGPSRIWLVRHGESAGNVARDRAHESGLDRIDLAARDVDIPLSPLGEDQAAALGAHVARANAEDRPEVILVSPYRRALQTAGRITGALDGGSDLPLRIDERLREKEFGILDGLTTRGVTAVYPEQAEFRRLLGKFYHRPPGGESWCDVIFRLRSLLDTVAIRHADQRVMIVAHQVVVLCMRYIIEELTEDEILAIDAEGDVANCSVTEYRRDPAGGGLRLVRYNATDHLERAADAEVTAEPDRAGGIRG
ncbi:broad specificity phosphatase PhoE [Sphingomonas jejuensis]|uniref:Broad specificity phosphatase PhoE n=1 Tax=Sphingomonas jejuensis TaxID=904715 RepID=A0ABX0XJG0_9SPHN|nr:histidine phosphatase family protein [Sphingomonas jejuensis]NJC33375.1 broad specificity phosphatase PhoE [Sphingomonas jejuensis]